MIKREYYCDMPEEFSKYENSKIVILPVPYDGTSTWVKGADKGPQAIIDASENIENYDIETDTEVYKLGIHTATPIEESQTPELMVKSVYEKSKFYLNEDKFLVVIGGEHSVSCGVIKAFSEKFNNLTILQIDAHADLRDEYHGSKYNHACVMQRAKELSNIVQVGIRSVCIEEKANIINENMFYSYQIQQDNEWIKKVINRLSKNVYLTIDLDGFDPSILPSTGTPEPGGLTWWQVNGLIDEVLKNKNLVGFDIVELCPNEEEKSSNVLAAKLLYSILSKKFQNITKKS